jgi:hypothetical protein
MMPKLYFGRLTLYDEEGRIYEVKNTKVTRAIPEINQILQARGVDIKFTLTEEER